MAWKVFEAEDESGQTLRNEEHGLLSPPILRPPRFIHKTRLLAPGLVLVPIPRILLVAPEANVILVHEGRDVLGVDEAGLDVGVVKVGMAAGDAAAGGRRAVAAAPVLAVVVVVVRVGVVVLLEGQLGGAGHGAVVDEPADGEADEAAEGHGGVVDGLTLRNEEHGLLSPPILRPPRFIHKTRLLAPGLVLVPIPRILLVAPEANVILVHEGRDVLGVDEAGLDVGVVKVGMAAGDAAAAAAAAVAAAPVVVVIVVRVGVVVLLEGQLGGAGHGAVVDEPADGEADEAAEGHGGVVDGLVGGGHGVALFGNEGEARADEDVDEELGAREGRGGGEGGGPHGGHGGEEAVGHAVGQRAEAHGRQHAEAVAAEDVAEGDEARVGADEAVDVAAEDGARRVKGRQAAGDGGRRHNGVGVREAVDEAGDRHGRAVADDGRKGRRKGEEPGEHPAAGQGAPAVRHGREPREDGVRVDDEEEDDDVDDERQRQREPLHRRQPQVEHPEVVGRLRVVESRREDGDRRAQGGGGSGDHVADGEARRVGEARPGSGDMDSAWAADHASLPLAGMAGDGCSFGSMFCKGMIGGVVVQRSQVEKESEQAGDDGWALTTALRRESELRAASSFNDSGEQKKLARGHVPQQSEKARMQCRGGSFALSDTPGGLEGRFN
ncbi:hypothetical protein BN1708_003294 [Verticillium longisporum]|uniref:Uncharacterized protein n=1 Tax=Verticillium longisporum TaxID=100787 RepID=A0A0G4LDB4_VERLO|nr:hypothetical protein BN1708_003294 [Verticillium longisporum]